MPAIPRLIGADGCPGAWMVALEYEDQSTSLERWETQRLGAIARLPAVAAVVVDIPIGLTATGSRRCDLEARKRLGRARGSSVFPAPLRSMLVARDYQDAQRIRCRVEGKGCSRQAFGILARVAEIDRLAGGPGGSKLHEGHPELAFLAMAGDSPPLASKHSPAGRSARWTLLRSWFPLVEQLDPVRPSAGDSLDALACLWTARRIMRGTARCLPATVEQRDPHLNRLIRIWF